MHGFSLRMPLSNRPLISTLVSCGLVTLILCQRHAGFMIIFVIVLLLPWLAYVARVAALQPAVGQVRLLKAGIWVVGTFTVLAVHAYLFNATEKYANTVSSAIEAYIATHGSCPQTLEAVGIQKADFRAALGYAAYLCEVTKPTLFYASTFVPFEQESYHFNEHRWVHVND